MNRKELHIVVDCGDSRENNPVLDEARRELKKEWADNGIDVSIVRLSIPGAFLTPIIMKETAGYIETQLKKDNALKVFVHLKSHGRIHVVEEYMDMPEDEIRKNGEAAYEMGYSEFNCGMLNAEMLALELQRDILGWNEEHGKPYVFRFKQEGSRKNFGIVVRGISDFRNLLKESYGYEGGFSGGFIRSIGNIQSHIAQQRYKLMIFFEKNRLFKKYPGRILVTASVHDYQTYKLKRVDWEGWYTPENYSTFADALHRRASEIKSRNIDEEEHRTEKQHPMLFIVHPPEIQDARARAAESLGIGYSAGRVFGMSNFGIADQKKPFDSYDIIGFYYVVTHLNPHKKMKFIILGRTKKETRAIKSKFEADPLVSFIMKKYGVRFAEKILPARPQAS